MTITVGVFGAGRIGQLHVNNIKNYPNVRIKTISDPYAEQIKDWFKTTGVENLTTSEDDILLDKEIDAVFICSSTDTHLRLIKKAIENGKHVFCEKPISFDQTETEKVYELIKNSGLKVQLGFNRRFDANFNTVSDSINKKQIGNLQVVKITSRDPEPPPLEYVKVSGGLFFDMTIHDFDMARFLAKSDVEEVYAQGDALITPEIKEYDDIDTAIILLKFKNGAIGTIDNSRQAVYGYDQRVEVFGEKGQLVVNNETPNRIKTYTSEAVSEEKPLNFFLERYNEAFMLETKNFFDAIENNVEVSPSYKDGMKAQQLAIAAKESMKKNKPIKV
ncbi:MAG: inositol 2-dehydrogenase [Staphylococcus equorum]|nr:inositol 2-dehydrogenase [Staphylococcus equorum]MDN6721365.1 inositol 2-dehydrogenase [Staphylococcus equorum]MDN6730740.1 inositol 2-dehydrogenase [Atopostipes suicloacalis]